MDGCFQDYVLKFVCVFKCVNVEIFLIGVGCGYSIIQFNQMVIDCSYVFIVDFCNFNFIIKVIKRKVCKGMDCFNEIMLNGI